MPRRTAAARPAPGAPHSAPLGAGESGATQNPATVGGGPRPAAATGATAWWGGIRQYIADSDLDWSFWALNSTQGNGYGRTFGAQETFSVLNGTWDGAGPP